MPMSAQRRARRLPFWWTIDMTGMVASHAAMVVMVPALAEDGDIIKQCTFALRIAYRGVPTDTLPVRTALGPYPTRAFDLSVGPVVSVLSDGEPSTSHAWLNNPSRRGRGAIPPEVGVGRQAGAMWNAYQADLHSVCRRGTPAIAGVVASGKRVRCYRPYLGTVLEAALLSHPSIAFTSICTAAARSGGGRFKGIRDETDAWAAGGCVAVHRRAWPGAQSMCAASVALPQRAWRCRASIAFTQCHQIEPPAGSALPDVVAQTGSVTSNAFVLRPPAGTFFTAAIQAGEIDMQANPTAFAALAPPLIR